MTNALGNRGSAAAMVAAILMMLAAIDGSHGASLELEQFPREWRSVYDRHPVPNRRQGPQGGGSN